MRALQLSNSMNAVILLPAHNGRVMIPYIIAGQYMVSVLDFPVRQVIHRILLLHQHIPNVFFVSKDAMHMRGVPVVYVCRRALLSHQLLRNLMHGIPSRFIQVENVANRLGLFRYDDVISLFIIGVAENIGAFGDARFKALADAPLGVLRQRPAFFLRKRRQYGQQHLRKGRARVDVLLLKEQLYAKALQVADMLQAFQRIAGKTRYALGDDVIDLARLTIADHSLELRPLFYPCSGDALIRIDVHQLPIGA